MIVAPLYFQHKVELGSISQSYSAFNHVLGDFSILINQFEAISAFAAGLSRLNAFLDRISQTGWINVDSPEVSDDHRGLIALKVIKHQESTYCSFNTTFETLKVTNLTVLTPDSKRVLIGNINTLETENSFTGVDFSVNLGDKILIVGPSGAVSSIFHHVCVDIHRLHV